MIASNAFETSPECDAICFVAARFAPTERVISSIERITRNVFSDIERVTEVI